MATYTEWVDDRITELGFEIKTANSDIEELSAFLEKTQATIDDLASKLGKLDADIAQLESDKNTATKQRETENDEFVKAQEDYSESVDALAAAIQVLKAQGYDRPQAEMMLQKMAVKTRGMRRVLAAFIEEKSRRQPGAPRWRPMNPKAVVSSSFWRNCWSNSRPSWGTWKRLRQTQLMPMIWRCCTWTTQSRR